MYVMGHTDQQVSFFFHPMQLHIVSYDVQRHATLQEAVTQTDALAVLGVLFKVSARGQRSRDQKDTEITVTAYRSVLEVMS